MRGHAVEERAVLGSAFGHTARDETPDIAAVPGHADFAWFVGVTKCFFVQEECFFQKCAFSSENAGWKDRPHRQLWENFGKVGLNRLFLMRPVVAASTIVAISGACNPESVVKMPAAVMVSM
jgi:hypothetical protein